MNKQELLKQIERKKVTREIVLRTREVIAKFAGYKQVNKRFVDALNAAGLKAWQFADGSTRSIWIELPGSRDSVRIVSYDGAITWERVNHELYRYENSDAQDKSEEHLLTYEDDVRKLNDTIALLKGIDLGAFQSDLNKAIHALEIAKPR